MDYIYIGKYVNTHGIKGEIRILSDFEYKDRVFVVDFPIYIGNNKDKYIIKSYRHHKEYEMITLDGINDIKDIISLKGQKVFINKVDLKLNDNEFLEKDLINLKVIYNNKEIGFIKDIVSYGKNNKVIVLNNDKMIPYNPNFIEKVEINNCIYLKNLEGLI